MFVRVPIKTNKMSHRIHVRPSGVQQRGLRRPFRVPIKTNKEVLSFRFRFQVYYSAEV